ncbi:putative siroheme synthase and ferrochelatase (plasmid) [Sinorhizobium fredii NGR234]|uniref:precorrin-2 dehydrogenase n=1 Tax=Sinorhizobium fredii (strain NBRC 101917 / NGR234) TaxID=394 RepID=C3KR81_SINFN|nr:SAM-dependent methyltransferase [Sinorhizobium fredii]ACP22589.1 putative siroheme synthase and ferrochelatase [Sinorhizobium fredii NGR234]
MHALPPLPNDRASKPQRVAALATLPLFWSLKGKRAVVAGGSDGAAWKAELLAACGAEVHIYASHADLGDGFLDLIARGAADEDGSFVHHDESWHDGIFGDAALAIADCDDDRGAEAFFKAARLAGVPVNVIDKPQFCQFQFGSIVNRSPVVVAISTDGAAPILAQAIRRRIETLLPPAIKRWAGIAQAIRERVNGRLQPGVQRRAFWERFVDRAFIDTPEEGVEARLMVEMDRLATPRPPVGRVTIVGAGPGDAELLTLKSVRALQAADVILYDERISNDVLELARREAKRILVSQPSRDAGIQDGSASVNVLARAGKRVVRLQAGDPVTNADSQQEAAWLGKLGIPVEIVPGVADRRRGAWENDDAKTIIDAGMVEQAHEQRLRVAGH